MKRMSKIVVMLGGPSAEREVSLRSGAAVAKALRFQGHSVTELDPKDGTGSWRLPTDTEVVFLALHGTYGEDGTIQRELEQLGVPYTGCDASASEVAFDKVRTKERCAAAGIPTPRSRVFREVNDVWPQSWQPPVVLKPIRQGSSVGLQMVESIDDFPDALRAAIQFDGEVLMEERIVGRETTVGVLGNRTLPIVEVRPRVGTYDYQNKYTPGATEYLCPAEFPSETAQAIQRVAWEAFQAVGGRDYARVDVMVKSDGTPWVLEVNTLPGMTETSLLPKAAAAVGIGFAELCDQMVTLALER